jgi:hypothetical protein
MDAAKAVTPEWTGPYGTLDGALSSTATSIAVTGLTNNEADAIGNQSALLIDNEIVVVTRDKPACTVSTTLIGCVARGQFGTTATTHSSGASFERNVNNHGNNIRIFIGTDGTVAARYFATWDAMLGQEYFTGTGGQPKWFQVTSHASHDQTGAGAAGKIWFEPQITRSASEISLLNCSSFNAAVHIGCMSLRTYDKDGGASNWITSHHATADNEIAALVGAITDSQTSVMFNRSFAATLLLRIEAETVRVSSCIGNTCTIVRGVNSTTAAAHADATLVSLLAGNLMCTAADCTNRLVADQQPVREVAGTSGHLAIAPDRWVRWAVLFDMRIDDYERITMWGCDEVTECVKIHDEVPLSALMGALTPNSLRYFWVEHNTSGNSYGHTANLEAWVRNFAMLVNPSDCTSSDCSALLVKPIR